MATLLLQMANSDTTRALARPRPQQLPPPLLLFNSNFSLTRLSTRANNNITNNNNNNINISSINIK
jgi:hypothetical protein